MSLLRLLVSSCALGVISSGQRHIVGAAQRVRRHYASIAKTLALIAALYYAEAARHRGPTLRLSGLVPNSRRVDRRHWRSRNKVRGKSGCRISCCRVGEGGRNAARRCAPTGVKPRTDSRISPLTERVLQPQCHHQHSQASVH